MLISAEGAVYAKRGTTFGTHSLISRSHQRAKIPFATLYSLGLGKTARTENLFYTARQPGRVKMSIVPRVLLRFCRLSAPSLLMIIRAVSVGLISFALLLPANAQYWGDPWGGRQQQRQQLYNPFGGGFWGDRPGGFWGDRQAPRYPRQREREREQPPDYSRAPPATPRKDAIVKIVVMGDANADWLAYGLEDAYADNPEIGIVRKHRTDSGLVSYDARRDTDWPQMAREIIAAEKPKVVVMMIGNNDRQTIREKVPPPPSGALKANAPPAPSATAAGPPMRPDLEQQPREAVERNPHMTLEQIRQAAYGPWEFHSEKWELAYIKRIDATIAALKSAGVPVIWVGLASQRGTKSSEDSSYLNELYRSRAEKAGIIFVDIWDGFVDEAGRYSAQGPDYEGQIRRLRTGDGVYFTKFGARKLAHYVEREVQRIIGNKSVPVALPIPVDPAPQAPKAKQGVPAQRPEVGPVVPLTDTRVAPEELLGGGRAASAPATDATVTRTLTKGEPVAAPSGRADDFSWPRGAVNEPGAVEPTTAGTAGPDAGTKSAKPAQRSSAMDAYAQTIQEQKATQRRPRMHR